MSGRAVQEGAQRVGRGVPTPHRTPHCHAPRSNAGTHPAVQQAWGDARRRHKGAPAHLRPPHPSLGKPTIPPFHPSSVHRPPSIGLRLFQRQLHLCPHQVVLLPFGSVRAQDELLLAVPRLRLLLLDLGRRGQRGEGVMTRETEVQGGRGEGCDATTGSQRQAVAEAAWSEGDSCTRRHRRPGGASSATAAAVLCAPCAAAPQPARRSPAATAPSGWATPAHV